MRARYRNAEARWLAEFDDRSFACPLQPGHPRQADDVAAVNAKEPLGVEHRFQRADRLVTEIFLLTIVDEAVMGVCTNCVDILDRNFPNATVFLHADYDRCGVRGREGRIRDQWGSGRTTFWDRRGGRQREGRSRRDRLIWLAPRHQRKQKCA